MKRVFLIDGTAFCYRAFHGIRSLSTTDGRPTNAVYGFATMLQALRDKERPDYLAVAFDVGKPTFRHKKFEEYKGQRKPMPEPLIGQLPLVKQLLAAYRIPVFEREGYEAEDVLATVAQRIAGGRQQRLHNRDLRHQRVGHRLSLDLVGVELLMTERRLAHVEGDRKVVRMLFLPERLEHPREPVDRVGRPAVPRAEGADRVEGAVAKCGPVNEKRLLRSHQREKRKSSVVQ